MLPANSKAERILGTVQAFEAALRSQYTPAKTYTDPVQLIVLNGSRHETLSDDAVAQVSAGWQHFAPNITSLHGPGNHFTALEAPHVSRIADWILQRIHHNGQ